MSDDNFIPGPISPKVDAASDTLFPRELFQKPMAQMTPEELFKFMNALLGFPSNPIRSEYDTDKPENKAFMEFCADEQEKLGNNGEPIQPEDCDVDVGQT